MFKKNTNHLQKELLDTSFLSLPEKLQNRIKDSWAETFYNELF